jgi:SAM-dependent methyltransferase
VPPGVPRRPARAFPRPGRIVTSFVERWPPVLRRYLEVAPLAWALPRSAEAVLLADTPLEPPVLDVGCGDGLFAELSDRLRGAVGVDLGSREVRRAAHRGIYRATVQADAARLPFATGSFATVVSISSLEHMTDLDRVLAELARVLRPGGRLVFSVPGPEIATAMFWPRILRRLGLGRASRAYEGLVNGCFHHHNLFPREDWSRRLGALGLSLVGAHDFKPPRAAMLQDLSLPTAIVPAALRRLTGSWVLWPRWRRVAGRALAAAVGPFLARDRRPGTNLFLCAERGAT